MHILIVEDSKVAAMVLMKHLRESDLKGQVIIASSIKETREFIERQKFDLIFLDVHLQDGKGTDIINELPVDQKVIFVTSDPEYAVIAFEHDALDYLVKPVTRERFDKAMARLMKKDEEEDNIVIRADFKYHKIRTGDILYAKANGDYISLITTDDTYVIHGRLSKFIEKLPQDRFMQCHRSYIVNTSRIEGLAKKHVMIGEVEIPVSGSRKKELADRFTG